MAQPTADNPSPFEPADERPHCLVVLSDQARLKQVALLLDELHIAPLPGAPDELPELVEADCAVLEASLGAETLGDIFNRLTPGSRVLLIGEVDDPLAERLAECEHMVQVLPEPAERSALRHRLITLTQADVLYQMLSREKQKLRHVASERDSLKHTTAFLEEKVLVLDKQRERLAKMIEKSNMITEISHKINSLDFEDIVKVCIRKIPYVLGARWASLYLYNAETDELVLKDHSHEREIAEVVTLKDNPNSLMALAIARRWPLIIQDFASFRNKNHCEIKSAYHDHYSSETCIVAPLIVGDEVIGVLNIAEKKDDTVFDEVNDLPPVIQLSAQVAAAIHNYNLFQRVQMQARSDSMTGFLNHRSFYEELEKAITDTRRYDHTFSLVMIDIDKFKTVNDKYGHQVGDDVIRHVSKTIRDNVRDTDVPSRYGGDEFAIILKQADIAEARVVAERIRSAVVKATIQTPKGVNLNITLSVGVAQYSGDVTSAEFMRQADQMMYRAKALGRNRVEEMAG